MIQDEVTSLERVSDLGQLELLMLRLPELVGSPLSINAVRQDLQVSHKTVARWVDIFERLYAVFRLSPFGAPRIRAVKREKKHYHWDWSIIRDEAARFENMAASHLLKWVHFEQDSKGRDLELRYFRDVDRREVDFVITEGRSPILVVECKLGDEPVGPALRYFRARFPDAEAWQVSLRGRRDVVSNGIRVSNALMFFERLV
ncbi:MAG: DUF4143 domain-containing protein [Myxococcota bacterium]